MSRSPGRRRGFSFLEVLIGIVILSFGLVPLLWALMGGTQQTHVTLRQVQAANHAANLLEALRATPFQELAQFPPCMAQLAGGDNGWRPPGEATELRLVLAEDANKPAPPAAAEVFARFKDNFFGGESPIVPPLDPPFSRYFVILKDSPDTPRYITLVARVEWEVKSRIDDGEDDEGPPKQKIRSVELRTVLSDPYFSDT